MHSTQRRLLELQFRGFGVESRWLKPLSSRLVVVVFRTHNDGRLSGSDHVAILGASGAVPGATQSQISRFLDEGTVVERVSGPNRYSTAAEVASFGVRECDLSWDRIGLTNGTRFPDALSGGVVQGAAGSVMLLTEGDVLDSAAESTLVANRHKIATMTFYGGEQALGARVRSAARNAVVAP